jgi:hypothetical protein
MLEALTLILFLVRNAASTLLSALMLVIIPIILFEIPFVVSIVFIKNITFAPGV